MSRDQQYLINNGWRLITSKRHMGGKFYFWDHDQYQRTDGMWWTQGDAIAFQRSFDRHKKNLYPHLPAAK